MFEEKYRNNGETVVLGKERAIMVLTALMGEVLAFSLYRLSEVVTGELNIGQTFSGRSLIEILIVGFLLTIVVGHYMGTAFVRGNKTNSFFAGLFATFLLLTGFSAPSIMPELAAIAIIIAGLEYFQVIRIDHLSGKIFDLASTLLVSLLGGYVNFVEIQPTLQIYVGKASYLSWGLVAILFLGLLYMFNKDFKGKMNGYLQKK